ncbi:DNA-processing protein DprA [Vampirovibrio sp.]|uniref:DNA-processing protein DprA n=1 Tax=Vampirovibrio sp. TaxID=2717857 RepID=UPI0035933C48
MTEHSSPEAVVQKALAAIGINNLFDDPKQEQTILVPILSNDDIDQDTPDPNDDLAAELSMLQQKSKAIAIIGSRNIPLPHQQIIEMLAFSLTHNGNQIITSGGSSGTNAAAIRGAMKGNPELLRVILPQTIGQQPSDVQDQLIGIPNIVEHPEWSMMKLADASRLCNREIVDEGQQLIILLSHDSPTLHTAIDYANENHKLVTCLYLD